MVGRMNDDLDTNLDADSAALRAAAAAALGDVDFLSLAGADRSVVLGILLASRLQLGSPSRKAIGGESADTSRKPPEPSATVDEGDILGRVASGLKIPRDVVELVYDSKDGQLGVVLSPRRLASDKANATRQIAQIVAAGRQAAGIEEWTPMAAVRAVVSDYGRLDSGNFAAHVQGGGLDHAFLFRGKGLGREVKVTRGGMEAAAELIVRLSAAST